MTSNYQNQSSPPTPDVPPYIQQAYTCFAQGDMQGAIAHFDAAIFSHPQCAEIYTARAKFRQEKLGDCEGALDDYTQAIDINPGNPFFYYWRSQTYLELGNHQKAIEDHNAAINLAPDHTIYHFLPDQKNGMTSSSF
ncbi:tetratricopeptide repeat protein [Chrysosporum bergii ANA360D]|uniref:Tetratricopeptide repeat protein n=1 Tax=Chrysosporum bergii ANA360D TaxID=617107 RepID=A0AA43GT57_9CYAN|nr:tetratricopeptide repeat protein [Chrysosporum bergii]MDH6061294.1 tetratricopeptide repeat protein [Chrysosporum bergii ANA360D]